MLNVWIELWLKHLKNVTNLGSFTANLIKKITFVSNSFFRQRESGLFTLRQEIHELQFHRQVRDGDRMGSHRNRYVKRPRIRPFQSPITPQLVLQAERAASSWRFLSPWCPTTTATTSTNRQERRSRIGSCVPGARTGGTPAGATAEDPWWWRCPRPCTTWGPFSTGSSRTGRDSAGFRACPGCTRGWRTIWTGSWTAWGHKTAIC